MLHNAKLFDEAGTDGTGLLLCKVSPEGGDTGGAYSINAQLGGARVLDASLLISLPDMTLKDGDVLSVSGSVSNDVCTNAVAGGRFIRIPTSRKVCQTSTRALPAARGVSRGAFPVRWGTSAMSAECKVLPAPTIARELKTRRETVAGEAKEACERLGIDLGADGWGWPAAHSPGTELLQEGTTQLAALLGWAHPEVRAHWSFASRLKADWTKGLGEEVTAKVRALKAEEIIDLSGDARIKVTRPLDCSKDAAKRYGALTSRAPQAAVSPCWLELEFSNTSPEAREYYSFAGVNTTVWDLATAAGNTARGGYVGHVSGTRPVLAAPAKIAPGKTMIAVFQFWLPEEPPGPALLRLNTGSDRKFIVAR